MTFNLVLKVIYHPLYSMNNFVTNKSKLPQDGAQVFPYMGYMGYMTIWEGHMIANHPHIWGDRLSCDPLTQSVITSEGKWLNDAQWLLTPKSTVVSIASYRRSSTFLAVKTVEAELGRGLFTSKNVELWGF